VTDRRLTSQTFLWLSLTAYGVAFVIGTVVEAWSLIAGLVGLGVRWLRRKAHV
jgi:hypothetical protein